MLRIELKPLLHKNEFYTLTELGSSAARAGTHLWLVGGGVRDLILGNPIKDFDLTSDASSKHLGELFANEHNGYIKSHSQFNTTKLTINNIVFDLATTRKEIYRTRAALPQTFPSNIEDDLRRRDFSVNALAVSLHPNDLGIILDVTNGYEDLNHRLIRALHPKSFQDDPTRIFRAIRYSTRLQFNIEEQTLKMINNDSKLIGQLSPARLRREVELIINEENALKMILRLAHFNILSEIHPLLKLTNIIDPLLQSVHRGIRGNILLGVIGSILPKNEMIQFKNKLNVTKRQAKLLDDVANLKEIEPYFENPVGAHQLDTMLTSIHTDAIRAIAGSTSNHIVAKNLDRYLYGHLQALPLTGKELMSLGIKSGPVMGLMQRELRYAMIDRLVLSRHDAVLFVLKKLEETQN